MTFNLICSKSRSKNVVDGTKFAQGLTFAWNVWWAGLNSCALVKCKINLCHKDCTLSWGLSLQRIEICTQQAYLQLTICIATNWHKGINLPNCSKWCAPTWPPWSKMTSTWPFCLSETLTLWFLKTLWFIEAETSTGKLYYMYNFIHSEWGFMARPKTWSTKDISKSLKRCL